MTTTDVQVWRYVVGPKNHEGWGIFLIDSSGMFSVVSDYGNYAYKWTSFGDCFRSFLCKLHAPYLGGKINIEHGNEYDEERTKKVIREHILSHRRERSFTREEALQEWILSDDMHDFRAWYMQTEMDCAYEFRCEMPPPQVTGFCERLFPRLVELLRADLAETAA